MRDERGPVNNEVEAKVAKALEAAEMARREERYDDGIAILLDVLEYRSQRDMVYYRLGNLYYDAGDLVRAEYVYRRALEENPHHVNAHYNMAAVYKQTGRLVESVRLRKRAVRLEATGKVGRYLVRGDRPKLADPPKINSTKPGNRQGPEARTVHSERGYLDVSLEEQEAEKQLEAPHGDDRTSDGRKERPPRGWAGKLALQSLLFVGLVVLVFLLTLYFVGGLIF